MNNWISNKPELLPDFIIGGVMKCGTTTLHDMLNMHPKIFIPKNEVNFFGIDDIFQHSDYNFYDSSQWVTQSMENNPKKMWDWYYEKFKNSEGLIKGEDSTTYLSSKKALKRISKQKKDIKLIFILRHPTSRAYSNYIHLLKTGRAIYNFEETIRNSPFEVLNRSMYKEHLENCYKYIPKSQVKIILFEEMITNTEIVLKDLCSFLEINFKDFPNEVLKTHANKSRIPYSSFFQLKKNYVFRKYADNYGSILPFSYKSNLREKLHFVSTAINYATSSTQIKPQRIKQKTKFLLDNYFYNELKGIDELVGQDVLSKWFPDKTYDKQ